MLNRHSFWIIVAALVGAPLFVGCAASHGRTSVQDRDGDGYTSDVDCDDDDSRVHPGANEMCGLGCTPPYGDGRDNDCDGLVDDGCMVATNCFWDAGPLPNPDVDGDGYPYDVDCNDNNAAIHPGADESCCDGVDADCDGDDDPAGWECNCFPDAGPPPDPDLDLDGYPQSIDCNDGDASVYPGAIEWCGDGIDQDCDGVIDETDCEFVGNGMLDAPPVLESELPPEERA